MSENKGKEVAIPVPWGTVAAQTWGDSKGEKWLLIHGWLDNSNSFHYLAPLLAQRGDTVIAIDLPGSGHSSWLPQGLMYHDLEFLGAIHRVIKYLKWVEFGLIGHSLGGGLALTYAATFPEQVTHLIMLDITYLPVRPLTPPQFQLRIRQAIESIELAEAKFGTGNGKVYKTKEDVRDRMMQPPVYLRFQDEGVLETYTPESADILLERGLKEVEGGFVLRRDIRLVLPSIHHIGIFNNCAKEIKCPHLIIEASKGPKSKFAHSMYDIYRLNPKFKQVDIEGLHHVHLNQHQTVNKVIRDFLDECDRNKKAKL